MTDAVDAAPDTKASPQATEARARAGDGVEALERGLRLLEAFDEQAGALALHELADRSGLTKPTILRLAASFERFGHLDRDADGRYRLGPSLWRLGALFRRHLDLGAVVRPALARLVEETGESASFYVRRGRHGVCLYRANADRLARDHVEEGEVIPMGLGSSGQILRAFSADAPADAASEAIRAAGVYVSLGERDPEVAGVCAPVLGPDGDLIGALSLSGLRARFGPEAVEAHRALVIAAARAIERRMGGG
jgi:DNA-binding IclR family transcriptional regulator